MWKRRLAMEREDDGTRTHIIGDDSSFSGHGDNYCRRCDGIVLDDAQDKGRKQYQKHEPGGC